MPAARRSTKAKPTPAAPPADTEAPLSPAPNEPRSEAPEPRNGALDATQRVAALRTILFDTIEAQVREGNVRVILWLADRLRLLDAQEQRTGPAEELRALLEDLPPDELREFASLAAK